MNLDIETAVEGLAEIGIYIPDESATRSGQTVEGMLKENMLLVNRAGNTVAHAICGSRNFLTLLPSDFLTEETLKITNLLGGSAAHYAALCRTLGYINAQLLTPNVVDQKDNFGGDLLHYAAEGQCLRDVPLRFLTPHNLFRRTDSSGKSPMSLTGNRSLDHIPWRMFKVSDWLKFLGELRAVSQSPFSECKALTQFVRKVEKLNRIKEKERCKAECQSIAPWTRRHK